MDPLPPPTKGEEETPVVRRTVSGILPWCRRHPWMLLAAGVGVALLVQVAVLPFDELNALTTKPPGETALMREHAARADAEGKRFRKRQTWVSLRNIPDDLVMAVIVSEDAAFWSHSGFDWYEFRESMMQNLRQGKAARGASTITQQLVKNLYLSSSRNPLRKMKEWVLTWYAERVLTKRRILEVYLNVIEWGDGVYGAQAAARYHFDKGAPDLTREECARLAAIIPGPRRYRADGDSKYVARRTALILLRMDARQRPVHDTPATADPADTLDRLDPVPVDIDTLTTSEDEYGLP